MSPLVAKVLVAILVFILSCFFGFLPMFISKKNPIKTKGDVGFNRKARQNVIFSALLNFGGGALLANCFLHWLPEVREGNQLFFN